MSHFPAEAKASQLLKLALNADNNNLSSGENKKRLWLWKENEELKRI